MGLDKEMLGNTKGAIKNGNLEKLATCGTLYKKNKTKTQHNMCWTPLFTNKHK